MTKFYWLGILDPELYWTLRFMQSGILVYRVFWCLIFQLSDREMLNLIYMPRNYMPSPLMLCYVVPRELSVGKLSAIWLVKD